MFSNSTIDKIENEYKQELSTYDVRKMVKVLERTIDLPVEEEALSGIQRKYNYCISKLFDGSGDLTDDDLAMAAENFFNIEPLLKKILFLVNRPVYDELKPAKKLECGSLLDQLGILEKIRTGEGYLNLKTDPEKFSDSPSQEDHILFTYRLRNVTAHEMHSWSRFQLFKNIQDVMITALFVCWKYKNTINDLYERNDIKDQIDVTEYIADIVKSYEQNVKNGFVFVPINWSYTPNILNGDTSESEIDIEKLSAQNGENSRLLLLGGAGCGKSTSIEYLIYQNAKACKKDDTAPIPVRINLAETNENWISVEEAVCDVLGISYEICERLLAKGGIRLYFDGVNEMVSSREIKTNIVRQIEKFLKNYKNVFVLITDRENVEIRIESDMKTYYLHQMGEEDIRKYIDSKGLIEECRNEMVDYALNMSTQGVKFTPIILNFLADFMKKNQSLPEDSTDLYNSYITYLLEREYNVKKDIIAAPGRLDALLKYLATKMEEDTLSINYIQVMRYFAQCVNYLGMANMDTKSCLDLSLQLGILERDGDMIRFANEEFYFSLLAKAIELGMEEWELG